MIQVLDRLAQRILDPTTRLDFFKVLAFVTALMGLTALFLDEGTVKSVNQELGVSRLWFVALCWACALLYRLPKSPGVYLLMVAPIMAYCLGTIYTASLAGSWLDVLLFLFLIYELLRHYATEKDKFNGIDTHVD